MDDALYGNFGPVNGGPFQDHVRAFIAQNELEKAYTTGSGIVQPGDTTPANFRMQFLSDTLEQVSYSQDDAGFMRDIPKEKIGSVTAEWSSTISYGGPGDNFVGETGSDGSFNVSGADDLFLRQIQNAKFMANYRQVSSVAQTVKSLTDPVAAAQKFATLELIGKMNLALYYGAARKNSLQWNGIDDQITSWATAYPGDSAILYDAGGAGITKGLFEDIVATCALLYGKPTEFRCSVNTYKDVQKTLFPEARYTEGDSGKVFGTNRDEFLSPFGQVKLKFDKMLRINRPLVANGPGVDGMPRSSATADTGSLTWTASPFVVAATTVGTQATAPGAGNFWINTNSNADTGPLATLPALPSGGGNQSNHLAAATYSYAVSAVVNGREGVAWVYGAASAGTVTGATGIAVTAGQIVQLELDPTQLVVASGSLKRSQTYFRVYRSLASGANITAGASTYLWLSDTGIPTSGNARAFDNGYRIPGSDTAFLLTTENNGSKQVFLGQLLPLMKKILPLSAMADQMALLFFGTPIVRVGRFHIIVRNIGVYTP
jgi:hypothetical protein